MSPEEVLGIAAAVLLGGWGLSSRLPALPLLANFFFLSFRFYALGLGYHAQTFLLVDTTTIGAIAILVGNSPRMDWRDIAILVLFVPAVLTYGFVTDPVLSYWNLWTISILQFALVAPWEQAGQRVSHRRAWGR